MTPLIRTTLLTFLAAMLLYEGALRLTAPVVNQGEDIGTTNNIRLENYADSVSAPDSVIVGSSLAGRMLPRMLPPGWFNIAISGGSAQTGLQIVAQSSPRPKRILIEINYLDRPGDAATVHRLLDWPQPLLRHIFWFYRSAYMPINLVFSGVETALVRHRARYGGDVETAPANLEQLLDLLKPAYATPPDTSGLPQIAALVRQLAARGIAVAFFEMPVDPSLTSTPHLTVLRSTLRAMFPRKTSCWLTLDQGEAWHTGDGEHLLTQDAARAARELAAAPCAR